MTNSTITPFVVSEAKQVELSVDGAKKTVWRKEILPSGSRVYKGKTLDFSKINPACKKAFDEDALPMVPFVLALADNSHPSKGEEVKHLEGDLVKLDMSESGSLVGYFDFSSSPKMTEIINKTNRKFGVSGRIDVGYKSEDTGKSYEYVLSHVCGTTKPHVKGLTPWEAVELSEEEKKDTIDFSADVIDVEAPTNTSEGDNLVAVNITQEQLDSLLKLAQDTAAADKTIQDMLNKPGGDGGDEGVKLSEAVQNRITAAETAAARAIELAETSQKEAAAERWAARKSALAREGVPPAILALAEPAMKLAKRPTIDLTDADGTKTVVDPISILGEVLDGLKGIVPLSEEEGTSVGVPGNLSSRAFDEETKALLSELDIEFN